MRHESVHAWFSRMASELPSNVAVDAGGGRRVSYAELEARSNSLANFLLSRGAAKGTPVAVLCDDRVETIAAVLGILKAGCVFAPLDPRLPAKRLESMVALLEPGWFVTESRFLAGLDGVLKNTGLRARAVCVDGGAGEAADGLAHLTPLPEYAGYFEPGRPAAVSEPDDMCYVYFTSGSTGQPKAIAGRLKGIDHFIRWEIKTLGLGAETRVSQLLPPSFDGSLRDLFIPLCTGGTACVPDGADTVLQTGKLIEWLEAQRVSVVHCVPSLFRSILNEELADSNLPELKYILMAGEPLLPSDVRRWTDVFGERVQLVNLYGTSETTMAKFAYFVKAADKERRTIPVGKPIEGAAAVVVDKRGRPCPPGMIGEIYIRTPYRALGYYNQPELTRAAFVPNPFSGDPADIVYKTGDLGRVLEDGNFEYLGRLDRQVKIRGNRVELAEIEDLLRGHEGVADVAVVDREDSSGHNYLCAYLVLGAGVETEALRELAAGSLPDYMIPSAFIVMEALPRTISGKIDRQALPAPGQTRAGMEQEFVAPRTPVEEAVANIWKEVLGIEAVGVHDNFFQLGGHSLRATQILSRVRAALEVEVPLRDLFERPTVAGLASVIDQRLSAPAATAADPIAPAPSDEPLPLSFAQQRLWFLDQMEPGGSAYNLPLAVRLTGELDVEALRRTLSEVVRRHEALRTTFPIVDGSPVQHISPAADLPLRLTDLSSLAEAEREERARELAQQEVRLPFDLARGPLLRAALIRLSGREHIALLTMHHIVSDGWSMGVLVREVAALYEAFARGEESPLPELTVQYADYAVWQRERLRGEALEEHLSYWREQLAGAPRTLDLPTDRPRPARQSHRGARLPFEVDAELAGRLRELSRREGVTMFMLLLAAWQVLLARYSRQEEVVVGAAIANRDRADIENLIGFFVNTLALRVRVPAGESFRGLLAQVREVTLGAYRHQELPFERVVEELQPERQSGLQPLFQVMFVYQNMPASSRELPGLRMGQVEMSDEAAVRSDLDFYLWEGDGLAGSFIYSTDLFDEPTIARMGERLRALLEEIVSAPEAAVADLFAGHAPARLPFRPAAQVGEKVAPSYHQERIWFIDQFENGNVYESAPTYHNIPLLLHLRGGVETDALEAALNDVVERHAALRTRFVAEQGQGYQLLGPRETLRLKVVETGEAAGGDALARATERALADALEPFALERDLPVRAALYRLPGGESLLAVTVHHIAADRPSLRLLAGELAEAYGARREGRAARLPELPVQYAQFAEGQRSLAEADFDDLLFYWKWQLRGRLPALELPEDRPRPAVHTFTAARETIALGAELASRLEARGREAGAGQHALALAAFKVLLHRYARQDEIVVGGSEPCRTRPELADLIGPLANLVVLRSDLGGNPPFGALVGRLARTVAEARAHQEMPFDKLVQVLKPANDMSRTALFDVLFQFDDEEEPAWSLGGAEARQIDTNVGYGKYDLNVLVRPGAGGLRVTAVYNADIYDAGTVRQMLRHYGTLLDALTADPAQRIDDVRLLGDDEERRQLEDWNATRASYPAGQTVHRLFAEQAARTPDQTAVVFGDERLTYRELDERANRLAHHLRRQGIAPDRLVALCLDKSAEMVVSLLAVLKAGGAYLPLDPAYPAERLQFVIEDSGAAHLVTTSALAGRVPAAVPSTVLLDAEREAIMAQPATPPDSGALPHHAAYCIYTSGSTGRPKGVVIEHRNVARLMVNDRMPFAFSAADVWTMFHSYCFDFSVWEMYGALLYGGRLVVVPEQVMKDPALYLDLLAREGVTVLNQTPTAFYNLAAEAARDEGRSSKLALRYVVFGGEALRPALLRGWRAAHPGVALVNMYGITETTVHVTFKELSDEDLAGDVGNIGRPIPTTTAYVLDERLRLLPVGVPGEICVGGAGVSRGYLNRDELTRQKFVPNPYKPGEVLYRSGDLARLLPSGEMVYIGRSDDQVQIRGFRVEPGEVQSRLLTHPLVTRAEVVARARPGGSLELAAYVVAPGAGVTELRAHVADALPYYMVPSAFVLMAALPLTPNGKVDRRALPEPDQVRPELAAAFAAPRTPAEETLAGIWAEVLGLARVGVHDNFFELGGHSLLATQVVSRVRHAFDLELPLRRMFELPTVAELAREIESLTGAAGRGEAPPVVPVPRDEPPPLSFAQQRLWFLHQLEPHSAAYNMHTSLRLRGPLDRGALERTVAEIVRRHEVLRTVFPTRDGGPFQFVNPPHAPALHVVDLREMDGAEREAEARRLATADARRPFDLERGPVLRVTLVRLAEEEHVLAFTMHHIVSDGWSMGVLVREVAALYEAFASGGESPLAELTVQYADYAVWQRERLRGEALESQLAYWRERLGGGLEELVLPTDRERPREQSDRGATRSAKFEAEVAGGLRRLSQREGVTMFMALLAAFQTLLQRYSGQDDIVVGTDIANRNRGETEGLIGFFVNQLVLRTDLSGNPTFRELLGRVRETALGAYAHQDVPFDKLVQELQPERDLRRSPLFNTKFILQNALMQSLELPGLRLEAVPVGRVSTPFDFVLSVTELPDGLAATVTYSTDLFDAATVERMLEHYRRLLREAAADPDRRLSDFKLLDESESAGLTVEDFPDAGLSQQEFESLLLEITRGGQ